MFDCVPARVPLFLQMLCFTSGANELAHVAKVVARQRSSKKTGRPHLVNTHMRVKPAAQLVLNGRVFTHAVCKETNLWFSELMLTRLSSFSSVVTNSPVCLG